MATTRKYAGLPDIDINSRDVFETPDLTDDASTLPTSPSRSAADDNEIDDREISHPRLKPSTARNVFTNSVIDASDVDFSDRVSGKRKSYKASTRRRRERGEDVIDEGYDDEGESDSDAEESVGRKLARLRREVEELKGMVEDENRDKDEDGGQAAAGQNEEEEGWEKLTEVLDGLMTARGKGNGFESILSKKLANGLKASLEGLKSPEESAGSTAGPYATTSYTVSYSPHFKKTHTLSKVADFDTRITLLERLLGISASTTLTASASQHSIIPSINTLTSQLTLLSSSTNTTLDAAARRVKALTNDAEKLTEARKAARAARVADEELMTASTTGGGPDSESEAKINALYGTLSTIEGLSPLLPAVMDRLRSLRSIHSEAARSVQALAEVERKQAEMQNEIEKWKETLEKVEVVVKDNEKVVGGNMKQVEGWVRVLEDRIEKLK